MSVSIFFGAKRSASLIKGVVIHDHFASYYQLEGVEYGLCNAHHLRELKALMEIEKESWANSMSKLLLVANKYKHSYEGKIPSEIIDRVEKVYDSIVERGLKYHESLPAVINSSNRGRKKRRTGHNLLIRLSKYRQDVSHIPHVKLYKFRLRGERLNSD